MADRRPAGEREFNPLDDALDLIGRVMEGHGSAPPQQATPPSPSAQREVEPSQVGGRERLNGFTQRSRGAPEESAAPEAIQRSHLVTSDIGAPTTFWPARTHHARH